MQFKLIAFTLFPLFFLLSPLSSLHMGADAQNRLALIYTNDVQGEIEPCG